VCAAVKRLLVIALVAACQGGLSSKDFPGAFARAVCQPQARCRTDSVRSEAACEDAARAIYGGDLDAALARGAVRFDEAQAQACVDGLSARGCQRTPPAVDTACINAIRGKIPAGQSCNWLYECAGGICEPDTPGACPAQCKAVLPQGAECPGKDNLSCDARLGVRCVLGHCAKPLPAGATCVSDADCDAGLFCSGDQVCRALGQPGAACGDGSHCAAGESCKAGSCARKAQAGTSCGANGECADGFVCKGLSKGAQGSCTPFGEVGAACVGADVDGCAEDLICVSSRCALKPVSGPCMATNDCLEGAAFCSDSGQCTATAPDGASCSNAEQCASGYCAGTCGPRPGACHEP
jgi:hypothetical protein